MNNCIQIDVKKCIDCPCHETDGLYTPDSFEHETVLYCTKTFKPHDSIMLYGMRTSGPILYRVIDIDDYCNFDENIPDWCPFVIRKYEKLAQEAVDYIKNVGNPKYVEKAENIWENAEKIFEVYSDFDYCLKGEFGSYLSSYEKKKYLLKIAAMLHGCEDFMSNRLRNELEDEDRGLVTHAVKSYLGFTEVENAIDMALCLAGMIDYTIQGFSIKLGFELGKNKKPRRVYLDIETSKSSECNRSAIKDYIKMTHDIAKNYLGLGFVSTVNHKPINYMKIDQTLDAALK